MGPHTTRVWAVVAVAMVFGLMAGQASGVTIAVDGDASDWGITLGSGTSAQWTPLPGVQGYWDWGNGEDYISGGGGYLDPGWGGQDYDAEALYFTYDATYAYFGVATGFPPTGIGSGRPGDIAIDFGCDGVWDFGIETTGSPNVKGGLYETTNHDWKTPSHSVSFPSELKNLSSSYLAWTPDFANLVYTTSASGGHYFIEAAVPLASLPLSDTQSTPLKAHWTMSCGNDVVETGRMQYTPPPSPPDLIPEPATCTVLGSGLLAMLALRVRKKKRKESQAT